MLIAETSSHDLFIKVPLRRRKLCYNNAYSYDQYQYIYGKTAVDMAFKHNQSSISGASDVALISPSTNEFLGFNGTTGKWQDTSLTGLSALATGGGVETVSALGSKTTTATVSLANGNVFTVTLGGNVTFTFSGATAGTACSFGLYVSQDATGSRLATWPASVKWAGGTAPTLTTTANALDILVFESINGGTTWYGSLVGNNFS